MVNPNPWARDDYLSAERQIVRAMCQTLQDDMAMGRAIEGDVDAGVRLMIAGFTVSELELFYKYADRARKELTQC